MFSVSPCRCGSDEVARIICQPADVVPLADGQRVQLKVVAGADHFFRDLYAEDVADAVQAMLGGR
jgi:alpha/beta superfamily hydrolase